MLALVGVACGTSVDTGDRADAQPLGADAAVGALDASAPDAGARVDDQDGDGLADVDDPAPTRANALLFSDGFDDAAMGWLFASVSMSIDAARSVLEVHVLEPFVREGWIGPRNRWVDYLVRTRLRVLAVGGSSDASSGRVGLIVRVNQVSPDRYLQCGIDLKQHTVVLVEHDGGSPAGTLLASAPIAAALGEWVPLSVEVRGTGLRCRAGEVEVLGASSLYGGGSVGFRSFDATFEAERLDVWDL